MGVFMILVLIIMLLQLDIHNNSMKKNDIV